MRLWSVHPKYLDVKGLVAVWREGLLAQAVLRGRTKGYRGHPQVERFWGHGRPLGAINAYLWHVWVEACARGYAFDGRKVRRPGEVAAMMVCRGQVRFETAHLMRKLKVRDPVRWRELRGVEMEVHPMMGMCEGEVEAWERGYETRQTRHG